MINILSYFVFGILFIYVGMPVLESLVSLIISFIEMIKSKINIITVNNNVKIEESTQEKGYTHVVGFYDPDSYSEEEYDEDEEDI